MLSWLRTALLLLRPPVDLRGDRGATAVEYALMVTFMALAIVSAVAGFGAALSAKFAGFVISLAGL